ncbi:MAG: hypothetical protein IPJ77_06980 [Planctomycetes bacterium]|nr:hypothetical protein [Planctomycetota bacterium]
MLIERSHRPLSFLALLLALGACAPTSAPPPEPRVATLAGPGAPSGLGYSAPSAVYRQHHSIAPNVPTVTGTVTSFSVQPALPAGLALDPVTGVIDGRPAALARPNTYTVTASNANGSTSAQIALRIVPFAQELDLHQDGQAPAVGLASLAWGRLVDVYDTAANGEHRLVARNLAIGEDVQTDAVDYELRKQLLTGLEELVVRHELGSSAFELAYDRLQTTLVSVSVADPLGLPPFTTMARNAVLVARFDDLLDANTIGADTLRLVANGSAAPLRAIPDANHVGLADPDGDGRFTAHPTRVLLDPALTWIDVLATQGAVSFQPEGLPPSDGTNVANVVLRIPTATHAPSGQTRVLANLAGNALATSGNGPVDVGSPTLDVVRGLRSGGATDVTGDAFEGFLRDLEPPQLVGSLAGSIVSSAPDAGLGRGRHVIAYAYASASCARAARRGDVLAQLDRWMEVVEDGAAPSGNLVTGVRVRMIAGFAPAVGGARLTTRFDPATDAARAACFLATAADGSGVPAAGLSPSAQLFVGFSEPLARADLASHDGLFLARVQTGASGTDVVPADLQLGADGTIATLTPLLPLTHAAGASESYWLNAVGGAHGLADLAGNALAAPAIQVPLSIDPAAPASSTGGVVLRFDSNDEVGNDARPELRGQFLFDFANGTLRPRPVTHFVGHVDRTQPVPAQMTAFAPGVRGPLNPLGAKLQHLWRYCDAGFQLLDEQGHNVDVEGLAWAPVGGAAIADQFSQFEIRLSHSLHLPDESLNAALLPSNGSSGLLVTYANNLLDPAADPQRVVHPRARGYTVNPAERYLGAGGTFVMPYPLNRGLPADQREYYTWRDTAVLAKGAPVGPGAELPIVIQTLGLSVAPGVPYAPGQVPTIGLPLLLEFRCFPDGSALGLNAFDVNLGATSSAQPNFRAFSTGGTNASGQVVALNPDFATVATGGFNPGSIPPGLPTLGVDNTLFLGEMNLVTRVSRAHTIFFPTGGPATYAAPLVVAKSLPPGTSIQLAYRGAASITGGANNLSNDARTVDFYGEPRTSLLPPAGGTATFAGNDRSYRSTIAAVNGSSYLQARITFVSNAVTNLSPELTALGLAWAR